MRSFVFFLVLLAVIFAGGVIWMERSIRFQKRFDSLIAPQAAMHDLDPNLIRAIIWRESRFQPHARGLNKERGLMQVTPGVAEEWARLHHVPPPDLDTLFNPETNVVIGTWYFARMYRHWNGSDGVVTDDPAAFALAEYNAGRSNALRWVDPANPGSAAAFEQRITFGSTHRYVAAILKRYAEYRGGYFSPPWMAWWDRLAHHSSDAPTVEGASRSPSSLTP